MVSLHLRPIKSKRTKARMEHRGGNKRSTTTTPTKRTSPRTRRGKKPSRRAAVRNWFVEITAFMRYQDPGLVPPPPAPRGDFEQVSHRVEKRSIRVWLRDITAFMRYQEPAPPPPSLWDTIGEEIDAFPRGRERNRSSTNLSTVSTLLEVRAVTEPREVDKKRRLSWPDDPWRVGFGPPSPGVVYGWRRGEWRPIREKRGLRGWLKQKGLVP